MSAAGLLSPDPLLRLYKERPLLAPTSERKHRGETPRAERVKIETKRQMMKWLKNDRMKVTLTERGEKTTTWTVDWGKPPPGLSHHQEESQTQTAFPPKILLSPPLPSTFKTVWSIKHQVEGTGPCLLTRHKQLSKKLLYVSVTSVWSERRYFTFCVNSGWRVAIFPLIAPFCLLFLTLLLSRY